MMPPLYRMLEIVLYAAVVFIPFFLIACVPYKRKLRFRPVPSCLIMLCAIGVHAYLFYLYEYSNAAGGNLTIAALIVNYLTFYCLYRAPLGQLFFTLLMLTNISNFVIVAAKCLQYALFPPPEMAAEHFRWSLSVCLVAVSILAYVPLYVYVERTYRTIFDKKASVSNWWYLWLIPGTFFIVWFYHIYGANHSISSVAVDEEYVIFSMLTNLGELLIYQIIVDLIKSTAKNMELDEKNSMLLLQTQQYEGLQVRIDEARLWRHDSRHHLAVMESYLDDGEYDKLKQYIHRYKKTLPNDRNLIFCQHRAVNALLMFFGQMANDNGADFDVAVQIPSDIPIEETDLTVLIGNLVENAAEACKTVAEGPRTVVIDGKTTETALYLEVKNTYGGELKTNSKGQYLSTKRGSRGLGLRSIRNIVEKYEGILEITPKDGIFAAAIYLPFRK